MRHDEAQFREVTTQVMSQGCPLPTQKVTDSMQHEGALPLRDPDRNEAHNWPRDSLADGHRVCHIILLPEQIGLDIRRRSQANLVIKGQEREGPAVSRRAGLDADQAQLPRAKEARHLAASQCLAQDDLSAPLDAVELVNVL